ncbi:MAG: NMD3-related protein [Nanoarchaeota archaeon]|nr:NMD3-related protein [Nanoarchaeota archaeon]
MALFKIPKLVYNPINKHEKYYEAIIQLRNPSDELINFINNQLRKNPDAFISTIIPLKDGFDIYISSQRFARNLGNKMKKAFKTSELKISRKIVTRNRQTSRDVYRATVFFKLFLEEEKGRTEIEE